jgi:hypothetical protein
MNRRSAALCFAFLLSLGACYPSVRGNGQPALETRPLEGFVDVDSSGAFDVRVEHGDTYSVAVAIDSNLLPLLETRVVGTTLRITSHYHLERALPGPHVMVRMPSVAGATLSGSGRLAVLSVHETRPVALRLSGSGNMDFAGTAPVVEAHLGGSGDANLAGSTERVTFDLAGSGTIDAANLLAAAGSIELDGSGNVRATINGPAQVSLSGSGDIDLFGDVTLQQSSKSGSGSIRVH